MRHLNRISLLVAALGMAVLPACAQDGKVGYQFLNVPVSAHSAALGGANISIVEDDASLMWTNAAMLTGVSDNTLFLGVNSYIRSSLLLSAGYVKNIGERGTLGIGAQMLNYGKMDETDEHGNVLGQFSAKDMNFQGSFSYMLTDYWSGSITAKVLLSNYAEFSSVAMGADLGLNYYNPNIGLSLSMTGRNFGGQITSLHDDGEHEMLPFNLAIGVSKDFANAPIRVTLTADDLTHWEDVNFIQHIVLGVDFLPSKTTWISLGYNFRQAHEMKVADKSKWAGIGAGAGLSVKKFKVGVAYGRYHVSASAFLVNASVSL